MRLTDDERRRIDDCVKAVERRTGVEIVTAITPKSDHYPEIPWKAFALGVSLVALTRVVLAVLWPRWPDGATLLKDIMAILGGGAVLALLSIWSQSVARLFLHHVRAETETLQHAQGLVLGREMFATDRRNAVLILVSLFERQVVIVPDKGVAQRLRRDDLRRVIFRMRPLLRSGNACAALCLGINEVGALLGDSVTTADLPVNGLPDAVIEERRETTRDDDAR